MWTLATRKGIVVEAKVILAYTLIMLSSLSWGRLQVAFSMLATCVSLSFLGYFCPSMILHTWKKKHYDKTITWCTRCRAEITKDENVTSIGKYIGLESLPDCRQGQAV